MKKNRAVENKSETKLQISNELNVCIILGKYIKGNSCGLKYIVVGCCLIAIKKSKYIKVHMATRWTIRHGLMLLWFTDLMNVTE